MKTTTTILATLGLLSLGANAAVTLTDHEQTSGSNPYLPSADAPNYVTGWETIDQRFGLDGDKSPAEAVSQSFTLANPVDLESIFVSYNDYRSSGTVQLTIDFGDDGSVDYDSGSITVSGLTTGADPTTPRTVPQNWLEFGLSAEGITLPAGLSSFTLTGLSEDTPSSDFIIAPQYDIAPSGYADGEMKLSFASTTGDLGFGITGTAVPEPSALLLLGLSGLGLLRRRRA